MNRHQPRHHAQPLRIPPAAVAAGAATAVAVGLLLLGRILGFEFGAFAVLIAVAAVAAGVCGVLARWRWAPFVPVGLVVVAYVAVVLFFGTWVVMCHDCNAGDGPRTYYGNMLLAAYSGLFLVAIGSTALGSSLGRIAWRGR